VDPGWGWNGWGDHYPWGGFWAGAAIGAAAAYGAWYYSLPPDCSPYSWGSYGYYHCGGVYYEPRYEGDTIVYVTVPDPTGGKGGTPTETVPTPTTAPAPAAPEAPPATVAAPPPATPQ
jgi:hypothetical protein